MRKVIAAAATISIAALWIVPSASAFEGGGRKPSEAPLITAGLHYTGQLNNHKADANFGGYEEVAIWRLPPLTTHDVITVNWHGTPFTHDSGFPICMNFAQGIDDYNWGSTYDLINSYGCYPEGPVYGLSGSGTAQTTITVQETNTNSSYLEFASHANAENPANFETFPYDFSVSPPLHYLGVAIRQVKRVSASGILYATANLANGLPAPDGLPFNLAVTWSGGGTASATGTSAGGTVGFQLALPETAFGKEATFVASHPADGTYQAISSPKLQVKVAKPKVPGASPCEQAQQRVKVLARQHRRLLSRVRHAAGPTRRRGRRRASRVGHKLRAARSQAASVCAGS